MLTGRPRETQGLETETVDGITVYYSRDFGFPKDHLRIELLKFLWMKQLQVEGYY